MHKSFFRIVVISLYVNKDNVIPQENNEQLEFVMNYHILFQMRTLICFVNYICRCILFLSILMHKDIEAKLGTEFFVVTTEVKSRSLKKIKA